VEKLESSIRSNLSALMSAYYDYKQMILAESAASMNFTIVNNQYLLGKKSILDVLDAQQQNLNAGMSVNTSFYGFLKSYFSLQKSLGRFDYMMNLQEKSLFNRRLKEYMSR
jgi:outer membrane protein TolC